MAGMRESFSVAAGDGAVVEPDDWAKAGTAKAATARRAGRRRFVITEQSTAGGEEACRWVKRVPKGWVPSKAHRTRRNHEQYYSDADRGQASDNEKRM